MNISQIVMHNIVQLCGQFPIPWYISYHILWTPAPPPPKKKLEYSVIVSTFKPNVQKNKWSYIPNTIHRKHYSSSHYSLELLCIAL